MPSYAVRRSAAVARDFAEIRRHLITSYEGFGDTHAVAAERAAARLREAYESCIGLPLFPTGERCIPN